MESAARNNLIDGMAGATEDAGKGGMFCTGSGRSVAVSDRAIRRARALVGEETDETINKRRSKSSVPNFLFAMVKVLRSVVCFVAWNWLSFCSFLHFFYWVDECLYCRATVW